MEHRQMIHNFSIISDEIRKVLLGGEKNNVNKSTVMLPKDYVEYDLILNWVEIEKECPTFNKKKNYKLTDEDCLEAVESLRPIFNCIHEFVQKNATANDINQKCNWTSSNLLEIPFKEDCYAVEWCLHLTALLEHSLGDIYWTITDRAPPHLLRDLLATEELRQYLGDFPIFFMKILMGTPNACNLRNIVWHGFVTYLEVPLYYASTFLMLITTINASVEKTQRPLKHRPFVTGLQEKFSEMNIDTALFNSERFLILLRNSQYISSEHLNLWLQSYEYWRKNQFYLSLLVMLPQFELLLRRIYGDLNKVDVTATMNEYYIIMDTTMESKPNGEINMIYKNYNESVLKAIYDAFLALKGPRIRDKFSHGEIALDSINGAMCIVIFMLASDILNESQQVKMEYFNDYETKFNANGILKCLLTETDRLVRQLKEIHPPEELGTYFEMPNKDNFKIQLNITKSLLIFDRPPEEHELVGKLIQIIDNIKMASINLLEGIIFDFCQFKEKKLRSRQRITLQKKLESLPEIINGFDQILNVITQLFARCQLNDTSIFSDVLLKKLKLLQKYAENLQSCSKSSCNEWIRCVQYSQDAIRTIKACSSFTRADS